MSGALSAMSAGGAGRQLTVGTFGDSAVTSYGVRSGVAGSLTPTEFLGGNITQLSWNVNNQVKVGVVPTTTPNSGWSSLSINGTVFLRADAAFSSGVWTWSAVAVNPIGTTIGAIIPVNIA